MAAVHVNNIVKMIHAIKTDLIFIFLIINSPC